MKQYLYVDAGYLDKALKSISEEYFEETPLLVEPERLTTNFDKVFYYDCFPHMHKEETKEAYEARTKPKEEFFDQFRRTNSVLLRTGEIRGRGRNARQKGVDVNIAVEMLTAAHNRTVERMTLLAGDLDFYPLLEALVRQGIYVTVWCEEKSVSEDLLRAADAVWTLNHKSAFQVAPNSLRGKFEHLSIKNCNTDYLKSRYKTIETIAKGHIQGHQLRLYRSEEGFVMARHHNNNQMSVSKNISRSYLIKTLREHWGDFELTETDQAQ